MDKKEYKELKKEFDLADPEKQKESSLKKLTSKGTIGFENNTTKVELKINDVSADFGSLSITGGKGEVSVSHKISSDCKVKLKVNGRVKDLEFDQAKFKFTLDKDIVADNVSIQFETKGDFMTFDSPAGEKDFTAQVSVTKRF